MPESELVSLKQETQLAYETYIREAEDAMEQALRADAPFLWSDAAAERASKVQSGSTIAEFWSGQGPVRVADGLIHDWVGASYIAGATLEKTLALIQDYENHKNVYHPEVMESRLIAREGDDFRVYLRLLKKKILTVVLDTEHAVQYSRLGSNRALCRSCTTRISEVEDAGKPGELVRPPDAGHGFMWRLYTYWRFEERNGGVCVECRAISLTRDVPKALRWIVDPIVHKLPRESLKFTLEATRHAVMGATEPVKAA